MTRLLLLFVSFMALQGCDALFAVDTLVCDPSGGPVAGARVSVHYASSGAERTSCTTDASGQCKASTVTGTGRFTVVVSAAGFKNAVITVPTSTASRLRVTLAPVTSTEASRAELVPGRLRPG